MSERRRFVFRQKSRLGIFSPFWTFWCVAFTIYFLWRLGQMIAGSHPWWLTPVPLLAILYMWTMRLKPVRAVVVEGDGNVVFERYWGRREVDAIYIHHVRRWLDLFPSGYVLRHAEGYELLFEDREQTAEVVSELLRHNPNIEVRGLELPPRKVASHSV